MKSKNRSTKSNNRMYLLKGRKPARDVPLAFGSWWGNCCRSQHGGYRLRVRRIISSLWHDVTGCVQHHFSFWFLISDFWFLIDARLGTHNWVWAVIHPLLAATIFDIASARRGSFPRALLGQDLQWRRQVRDRRSCFNLWYLRFEKRKVDKTIAENIPPKNQIYLLKILMLLSKFPTPWNNLRILLHQCIYLLIFQISILYTYIANTNTHIYIYIYIYYIYMCIRIKLINEISNLCKYINI